MARPHPRTRPHPARRGTGPLRSRSGEACLLCEPLQPGVPNLKRYCKILIGCEESQTVVRRSPACMNSRLEIDGTKLPPFLAAKNLEPFINQIVIDRTKQVKFRRKTRKNRQPMLPRHPHAQVLAWWRSGTRATGKYPLRKIYSDRSEKGLC